MIITQYQASMFVFFVFQLNVKLQATMLHQLKSIKFTFSSTHTVSEYVNFFKEIYIYSEQLCGKILSVWFGQETNKNLAVHNQYIVFLRITRVSCIKIYTYTVVLFSAVVNVQVYFKTWTMMILLFVLLIKCNMSNNELLACVILFYLFFFLINIYILLDVLLCSIAEYFYELCRILARPQGESKYKQRVKILSDTL